LKKTRKNKQLNTVLKSFYYSKYMSIIVGIVCVLITIFLVNITRGNDLKNVRQDTKSLSEIYLNRVENRIDNIEFNLAELAGYGPPTTIQEKRDWDMRTDFYLENLVGAKTFVFFDKVLTIQRVNPPNNSDYTVGTKINTIQSNPKYTNLILPIYNDDVLAGFILSDIDVTELILLIDLESEEEYMLQVYEGDTLLASSENWKDSNSEISESKEVIFKDKTLRFVLVPSETTILENTSNARLILYFGLCLSALISYIWYSRTLIEERKEALASTNEEMKRVNKELEAFSYSVSHDLRAPLRHIVGYSEALKEDYSDSLDDVGKEYIERLCYSAINMGKLINDILKLSKVTRGELNIIKVNLSNIVISILDNLKKENPDRNSEFRIQKNIFAKVDENLIHIALENLLGNAWKFTKNEETTVIQFGTNNEDGERIFYIKDNGAGFDSKYADTIFEPFRRLHKTTEFEGTGIGTSLVKRVISRHGGKLWAEGEVGKGATFYFTLEKEE